MSASARAAGIRTPRRGRGSREPGRIVERLRGRPIERETLRVTRGRRLLDDGDALLAHVERWKSVDDALGDVTQMEVNRQTR